MLMVLHMKVIGFLWGPMQPLKAAPKPRFLSCEVGEGRDEGGSHSQAPSLARGISQSTRRAGFLPEPGPHRACSAFTISFLTPFTLENLFPAFVWEVGVVVKNVKKKMSLISKIKHLNKQLMRYIKLLVRY